MISLYINLIHLRVIINDVHLWQLWLKPQHLLVVKCVCEALSIIQSWAFCLGYIYVYPHDHEGFWTAYICCSVWHFKLVPVCYRPSKATPNEAVMDQDGWPIKHCRSMWAVRLADSLMMSAASWSVYEEIYDRRPPARSLECLYYVFWSWRPNCIPRRGALACKAAP